MKAYNLDELQKRGATILTKEFVKKVMDLLAPLKPNEALSTRQIASAILEVPVDSEELTCYVWDGPILQPLNALVRGKKVVKVKVKGVNSALWKLDDFEYKRLHK